MRHRGWTALGKEALHLDRAVRTMRSAFWFDPDGARDLLIDDPLRPRVRKLIDRFTHVPAGQVVEADATFMVAALHYLLREFDVAHETITAAIGDNRPETMNLRNLIAEKRQQVTSSAARVFRLSMSRFERR